MSFGFQTSPIIVDGTLFDQNRNYRSNTSGNGESPLKELKPSALDIHAFLKHFNDGFDPTKSQPGSTLPKDAIIEGSEIPQKRYRLNAN